MSSISLLGVTEWWIGCGTNLTRDQGKGNGMSSLPSHGRVDCSICFEEATPQFDHSYAEGDSWRIKSNPLSWGSAQPEVLVLGFSKGPIQSGALAQTHHDDIAYKGGRTNVWS